MANPAILIVDDDPLILKFVGANLKASGYEVLEAEDGESALEMVGEKMPDLVLLDIMMPEIDGVEVCRRIRERSQVPIVMLSAKDSVLDKAELLNLGADDYITKPVGVEELLARVRAVLRRQPQSTSPDMTAFASGDIKVNFVDRWVTVGGRKVNLSPTEYNLLRELVLNADKVLTHRTLLSRIWGPGYVEDKGYLRVYIGRLRRKIEADPENPKRIVAEPGVGYYFLKTRPEEA